MNQGIPVQAIITLTIHTVPCWLTLQASAWFKKMLSSGCYSKLIIFGMKGQQKLAE